MSAITEIYHAVSRRTASAIGAGASGGMKILLHWWGVLPAAGIFALLSVWDHTHEKERLREEYENEIAAKLGKKPEFVTTRDMEEVAKDNPTLHDALRRSRWKRNLSIAVTTASMIGAFALAVWLGPLLAGAMGAGTMVTFMCTGLIGFCSFMVGERALEAMGRRKLGLSEPQVSLSLPGQIRYLARLQNRRVNISQEQVLATFIVARPELAAQIAGRYGAPFAALPASVRAEVVESMGPDCQLAQITEDINNRVVRAQELAFIVQGQASGVEKLETPRVTALEKARDELQQGLAAAKHKIGELSAQAKEKAADIGEKMKEGAKAAMEKGHNMVAAAKEKLAFRKAAVSGAVPKNQFTAQETLRSGAPASGASLGAG